MNGWVTIDHEQKEEDEMKRFLERFRKDRRGQGMVEYALIIALVSIVAIALLITMGDKIKAIFTDTNEALDTASTGAITVTMDVAEN